MLNEQMPNRNQDPLKSLKNKFLIIFDLVTAVALGFKHGLFLHGGGGIGKSYSVINRLKELAVAYQLFNSRMSGAGLYLALKAAPDAIHVIEDTERLTKDPNAQGVLRSVTWSQPGHERIATWKTATSETDRFVFRGGVIIISNRPMADHPELRALATRIEVFRLEVTDAEQTARMLELASLGYRHKEKLVIEPKDCLEVTEYLLGECRAAGCPLDLRLQQKAFQTFLQWEYDLTKLDWKDLVTASVREAAHHFRQEPSTMSQEEKRKRKRNIIRELIRQFPDCVKEQEEQYVSPKIGSRPDFYRRKREIESGDFDEVDAE